MTKSIASRVGVLQAYDSPHAQNPEDIIQFRVDINFLKPLKKGISVRFGGGPLWLPLVYEGLLPFVFAVVYWGISSVIANYLIGTIELK